MPLELFIHDCLLYVNSGIEFQMESIIIINGTQYFIDGESGYTARVNLDVSFAVSNLTETQKAANFATAAIRVT